MIALDSGDKIRGDASAATVVDYTLHGIDNDAFKQLADGQLASSIGDLYTADSADVVLAIILVNTDSSARTVNLYLTPSGGTARRLVPKDCSLTAGYSLHTDGVNILVLDTSGQIQESYGAPIAHDLGGVSHNADTLANLNTKVSDATLVDTGDIVLKTLFDAQTILQATSGDTPVVLTVNEQEVVGRLTGGNIDGISLGIADNNVVQIDHATPVDNDYAKFTANGLEGRSYSEVKTDLGLDANARAYQANAQTSPAAASWVGVLYDTESWDTGGDMDVTVRTGTADATQANKLHDADGGFEAGDVGAWIWNTTDNTYTVVTAFVDAGELTLSADIMVNGEGYKLYRSWFICPADGKYFVTTVVAWPTLADGVSYGLHIDKNLVNVAALYSHTMGAASYGAATLSEIIDASASDKITVAAIQVAGVVEAMVGNAASVYFSVHRLS